MGRRGSSGGRSSARSGGGMFGGRKAAPAPSRRPAARAAPPPAQKQQAAPPPAQQQPSGGGGMLSGLASTVMQGMAFGTGSAVAHRAVDAIAGPRQVEHVHSGNEAQAPAAAPASQYAAPGSAAGACGDEYTQFNQCVQEQQGNIANCRFFYDVLSQCQGNSNSNSESWN